MDGAGLFINSPCVHSHLFIWSKLIVPQSRLATSIDVERFFSHGRLLLSHVRSWLSAHITAAIMCLGHWRHANLVKTEDVLKVTSLPVLASDKNITVHNWYYTTTTATLNHNTCEIAFVTGYNLCRCGCGYGCFIAFITHLTWEFSSLLFRPSTIQPITISHLTADPVWHSYPVYPPHFSIPIPLLCCICAKSSISPSALSCLTKCIHQASRPPISSTTGTWHLNVYAGDSLFLLPHLSLLPLKRVKCGWRVMAFGQRGYWEQVRQLPTAAVNDAEGVHKARGMPTESMSGKRESERDEV